MDTLRDKNHARRALGVAARRRGRSGDDVDDARPGVLARQARACSPGTPASRARWLALWLQRLGASVHRLSRLPPPTAAEPVRPWRASASAGRAVTVGDIRDAAALRGADARRRGPRSCSIWPRSRWCAESIATPLDDLRHQRAWARRNVLEAVRALRRRARGRRVTTDKVYENREWAWPLPRERRARRPRSVQRQQGRAPRLVIASYRDSFLARSGVAVATRACRQRHRRRRLGGGPPGARLRCAPGMRRRAAADPPARRDPALAARARAAGGLPGAGRAPVATAPTLAGAYNFGPRDDDALPVRWLVDQLRARHARRWRWQRGDGSRRPARGRLARARQRQGAQRARLAPRWALAEARRSAPWTGTARMARRRRLRAALCVAEIDGLRGRDGAAHEPVRRHSTRRWRASSSSSASRSATRAASSRGCSAPRSWRAAGWRKPIAQINHTLTRRARHGARHALPAPAACRDEARELPARRGLRRRGRPARAARRPSCSWHAEKLSADNGAALLIPEGLRARLPDADATTASCSICHSRPYAPSAEGGLESARSARWRSPGRWPSPSCRRATRSIRCSTRRFRGS